MSARLRAEVSAYAFGMLDDAWAEAVHRDVANTSARAPAGAIPYRAATLRLQQNLAEFDKLDARGQQRFLRGWRKWKAIGQVDPSRA